MLISILLLAYCIYLHKQIGHIEKEIKDIRLSILQTKKYRSKK